LKPSRTGREFYLISSKESRKLNKQMSNKKNKNKNKNKNKKNKKSKKN